MKIGNFDGINRSDNIKSKSSKIKKLKDVDSKKSINIADKIEISDEAKKLLNSQEEVKNLKSNLLEQEDVESNIERTQKIADIKKRIDLGYYNNNPEVNQALAKILSKLFGIS